MKQKTITKTIFFFFFLTLIPLEFANSYTTGIKVPDSFEHRNRKILEFTDKLKQNSEDLVTIKKLALYSCRNAHTDFNRENVDNAIKWLEKANKMDRKDYQVMAAYGDMVSALSAFVDGEDIARMDQLGFDGAMLMNKAVENAPDNIDVLMIRAMANYNAPLFLNKIQYAKNDFNRIYELVNNDFGPDFKAFILYHIGNCHQKSGNADEARSWYHKTTEVKGVNPQNFWISKALKYLNSKEKIVEYVPKVYKTTLMQRPYNWPESDPDYWPTQNWEISTPEEQGMNSNHISKIEDVVTLMRSPIHSITVIKNGYMILDKYYNNSNSSKLHSLYSASKSITSVLVGIAIDQGLIKNIDDKIINYLPVKYRSLLKGKKKNITIKNLLTMTAGFKWDELSVPYGNPDNSGTGLMGSKDWVEYILKTPLKYKPGKSFNYNSGETFLLNAIIKESSGMTSLEFANKYLFNPLGIKEVFWQRTPDEVYNGGWGLSMKPHDLVKIGYLYLNKGKWEDKQIVSIDWIEKSTLNHVNVIGPLDTTGSQYGYQWYSKKYGFLASGFLGQKIFVVPEHNLVVAFTGDLAGSDMLIPHDILENYIIPAVDSKVVNKIN